MQINDDGLSRARSGRKSWATKVAASVAVMALLSACAAGDSDSDEPSAQPAPGQTNPDAKTEPRPDDANVIDFSQLPQLTDEDLTLHYDGNQSATELAQELLDILSTYRDVYRTDSVYAAWEKYADETLGGVPEFSNTAGFTTFASYLYWYNHEQLANNLYSSAPQQLAQQQFAQVVAEAEGYFSVWLASKPLANGERAPLTQTYELLSASMGEPNTVLPLGFVYRVTSNVADYPELLTASPRVQEVEMVFALSPGVKPNTLVITDFYVLETNVIDDGTGTAPAPSEEPAVGEVSPAPAE